jgi:hypothetical protein
MRIHRILHVLCTLCAAATLVGCASSTEPTDDLSESSEEALNKGGRTSPRLGYSCEGLKCTCIGDDDCNDMFSDGVCGDIAVCDDTDPLNPRCECIIVLGIKRPSAWAKKPPTAVVAK